MKRFEQREKNLLQAVIEDNEKNMSPYACRNHDAIHMYLSQKYDDDVLRTQFAIDTDKILHSALYNRGNDKTQVFSFYRNDDITRRSTHVQFVSRIARIIGRALRLNLDLIEAIAIGHDVGHTPFGHKGEEFLSALYYEHTGRYFNHNVHSVRVLENITNCNLTLQTLDGILCHCGEKAFEKYEPASVYSFSDPKQDFETYNKTVEKCYTEKEFIKTLRPNTLEGCVVRISDMIAYLGKDRQDASKVKLQIDYQYNPLGRYNRKIVTDIIIDLVVNSLDKPYLSISKDVFDNITALLKENNEKIYQRDEVTRLYYKVIQPMMNLMYERFLEDVQKNHQDSLIYRHYLNTDIIGNFYRNSRDKSCVVRTDLHNPNDMVVDFIASMTDDYFIDAFTYLFPKHELVGQVKYIEYFDKRYME